MVYTQSERLSKKIYAWIIILLFSIGTLLAIQNYLSKQNDKDCLEWGVVKRDSITQNEQWAPTHSTPRDREDAERMANDLEAQELTGQYHYYARCKKWRQE